MMWDFRNWIHRGRGLWPRRPWRSDRPIKPPSDLPKPPPPPADEKWLDETWQPEKSADDWKKADPSETRD